MVLILKGSLKESLGEARGPPPVGLMVLILKGSLKEALGEARGPPAAGVASQPAMLQC